MAINAALIEETLSRLRKNGARVTGLRRAIVDIFMSTARPLSVVEITTSLKKEKLTPNKSSIYREIDFLLEQNLLNEIDMLEGMKRYEWKKNDAHHHHHAACTKCGTVVCIELCFNEKELNDKIKKKSGFEVTSHVLEFFGVCASCR